MVARDHINKFIQLIVLILLLYLNSINTNIGHTYNYIIHISQDLR